MLIFSIITFSDKVERCVLLLLSSPLLSAKFTFSQMEWPKLRRQAPWQVTECMHFIVSVFFVACFDYLIQINDQNSCVRRRKQFAARKNVNGHMKCTSDCYGMLKLSDKNKFQLLQMHWFYYICVLKKKTGTDCMHFYLFVKIRHFQRGREGRREKEHIFEIGVHTER